MPSLNVPSIVRLRRVPISLLALTTNALLATAVPAVRSSICSRSASLRTALPTVNPVLVTTPEEVTAPAFQTPVVIVPTVARLAIEVIAACVAPVTVAAVPDAFPVTSPVKAPTNAVEVILVAPVTTPASILIVPSNTIADPAAGVMLTAPEVAVIVFALTLRLSTCNAVNVPTVVKDDAVTPEANVVPVNVPAGAVPEILPVTLPVKAPAKTGAVIVPVLGL